MNQYRTNSIDEILLNQTVDDAWGEIYSSTDEPKFIIHPPSTTLVIRVIGRFLPTKRVYIPQDAYLQKHLSREEFESIVQKNNEVYTKVVDRISSKISPDVMADIRSHINSYRIGVSNNLSIADSDRPLIKTIMLINSLYTKSNWQPCVVANCLVLENNTRAVNLNSGNYNPSLCLFPMNKNILSEISNSYLKIKKSKKPVNISGLFAHNITVMRSDATNVRHTGIRTRNERDYNSNRYSAELSLSPTHLTNAQVNDLIRYGIFDLKKSIRWSNNKTAVNRKGFMYSFYETYKNNDEMIQDIVNENNTITDSMEINEIEEHIHNIPQELLSSKGMDTIGSIEL